MGISYKLIDSLFILKLESIALDIQPAFFNQLDNVKVDKIHGNRGGLIEKGVDNLVKNIFFAFEIIIDQGFVYAGFSGNFINAG
jgi:hypothetical protein